jgi:hypothetical protein
MSLISNLINSIWTTLMGILKPLLDLLGLGGIFAA